MRSTARAGSEMPRSRWRNRPETSHNSERKMLYSFRPPRNFLLVDDMIFPTASELTRNDKKCWNPCGYIVLASSSCVPQWSRKPPVCISRFISKRFRIARNFSHSFRGHREAPSEDNKTDMSLSLEVLAGCVKTALPDVS